MSASTSHRLPGHPTAERSAEIDRDILEAAIREFAEHGSAFRMDAVAARAGATKQAIYRRWPSKDELLIQAVDRGLDDYMRMITFDLPGDPLQALRLMAWRMFDGDPLSIRIAGYLSVESLRQPALRDALVRWRKSLGDLFCRRLLEIEQQRRQAEPADKAMQADILMDSLRGTFGQLCAIGDTTDEAKRRLFDRLWATYVSMIDRPVAA
ncbi:helix-turn-helix domain-containing protein [Comamonadaceae bacterium PP-2]